jgi:hypothetical protein
MQWGLFETVEELHIKIEESGVDLADKVNL